MKESNSKVMAITVFLAMTIIFTLVMLPNVAGQTTNSKATYAFIVAWPNPVGVGQQAVLLVGIPDFFMNSADGFNMTITITKPDGTIESLERMTDSSGATGVAYTPTQVGTYYLQATCLEQEAYGMLYKSSTSTKISLTVVEEESETWPGLPLPAEYWTRPINAQLREWTSISGNWLVPTPILPTDNLFGADNDDAPESAHILWTTPLGDTIGGLAGGVDDIGYGIGDAYEGKFGGQIIIGGILFYNKYDSISPKQEVVALDLHTGKELWTKTFLDNRRISFGQVLRYKSINYMGAFSYLWVTSGSNWYAFEPLTGELKYNMTNVPSGSNIYGPKGEILRYTVNTGGGWMAQWNSTKVPENDPRYNRVSWGAQVVGREFDATLGYDWNVTIPTGLPGRVQEVNPLDKIVGASITPTEVTLWALNLNPGQEGQLIYKETWQAPSSWYSGNESISWAAASFEDDVAVLLSREKNQYYGFDLSHGRFLWGPLESEPVLNIYDRIVTINYGRVVSSGASGYVHCYNATTGTLLWNYTVVDPYTESLTGSTWWMQQLFIADKKVYLGHVEHSPNQPLPRGAPFTCLDIETGDEVWKMVGGFRQTVWGGKAIIGDSIIGLQNTYDQRVYAIGKGPSATAVEAPMTAITLGSSLVIRGAVTDVSPGTQSDALTLRFPNGVPAVSDGSMSEWMKYVYMQFPLSADATGVEVLIDVIDSNGNYRNIGTTTSDVTGFFSFEWKPDIPGKYTVIATFAGSKSYYPSCSETAFTVTESVVTPAPTPTPAPMTDTYILGSAAGIIIAIVVVGLLLFLLLRKR